MKPLVVSRICGNCGGEVFEFQSSFGVYWDCESCNFIGKEPTKMYSPTHYCCTLAYERDYRKEDRNYCKEHPTKAAIGHVVEKIFSFGGCPYR